MQRDKEKDYLKADRDVGLPRSGIWKPDAGQVEERAQRVLSQSLSGPSGACPV